MLEGCAKPSGTSLPEGGRSDLGEGWELKPQGLEVDPATDVVEGLGILALLLRQTSAAPRATSRGRPAIRIHVASGVFTP